MLFIAKLEIGIGTEDVGFWYLLSALLPDYCTMAPDGTQLLDVVIERSFLSDDQDK